MASGKGEGVLPESIELLLDPGDALRRRVFPQDLVVFREGAPCLVGRAQKAGLRPVAAFDDSRLAVDEDAVARYDPDLDAAAAEQVVKAAITLPVQQRLDKRRRFVE